MKKAHITVAVTYTRGFEVEYETLDDLREQAVALAKQMQDAPEEMEGAGENWDYAATDEDGYNDLIPWAN